MKTNTPKGWEMGIKCAQGTLIVGEGGKRE